eukprot:3901620-Pyramimonas_sp.AAC.1
MHKLCNKYRACTIAKDGVSEHYTPPPPVRISAGPLGKPEPRPPPSLLTVGSFQRAIRSVSPPPRGPSGGPCPRARARRCRTWSPAPALATYIPRIRSTYVSDIL